MVPLVMLSSFYDKETTFVEYREHALEQLRLTLPGAASGRKPPNE